MNPIETRGEARLRKNRERQAAKRMEKTYRDAENERSRQRIAAKRQNEEYNKSNQQRGNARATKRIARDIQASEAGLPLRVLEMDEDFERLHQEHSSWPQRINSNISKESLANFRAKVQLDELRELPCAVCSEICSKDKWKKVRVDEVNISLLKAPIELTEPRFEINFDYGHPSITKGELKVLLDRAGFIFPQDDSSDQIIDNEDGNLFDLRICNICYTNLKQHRTPPLSLANNLWIGPTPSCLEDLTIPEQLLISPGYLCMNLIQLSNKRHSHHKIKGHTVILPQEPSSLANLLPLPMYKLCEHLKVVFVGQGTPSKHHLKKVLQVRKSKIIAALIWLFEHNILFKDIGFDKQALDLLPEGEIPEALLVTTTTVDINPKEYEHYTGYTKDPLEDNNNEDMDDDDNNGNLPDDSILGGIAELRTSAMFPVDNISVSEKGRTLSVLQKIVDESSSCKDNINAQVFNDTESEAGPSQPQIIRMPHSSVPFNEYKDENLFPAGFPVLFPYGVGGHEDSRRSLRLSLKSYAKHLMRHRDPKFRQHRSFPFVIFNILQRREVITESYGMTKNGNFTRSAELISSLTLEDMKKAIEQEKNGNPVTNPAVLELLKNITSVGSKIMASFQSRTRMRNEMRAIMVRDGMPSLFITINPADLHSPIVMMYAGKEIDIEKILATNDLENFPTATERSRLAHLDPCAVAKYFDIVISNIISTIIGYGNINGGVFGKIKNYYGVVEYQDRGTPHCHMLIWLHGSLDPINLREKLIIDGNFSKRLLQYVSDIVKEDISYLLPEGEIQTDDMLKEEYMRPKTIMEKRIHPSLLPIPDPKSSGFDDKFRSDLLAIIKRTLFHSCCSTCKKYRRGSDRECRFDFPRELVDPPGMIFSEQGIIALQRANAYINNHNPYITAACRGNNDIKFISARQRALSYIYYITDYITKSDVSKHSAFLMCAVTLENFLEKANNDASLDLIKKSRTLVSKCLNKIAGQSELTGPQVAAYLLEIRDHYNPHKFVSIFLQNFEAYISREWQTHLQSIGENSDNEEPDNLEIHNEEDGNMTIPLCNQNQDSELFGVSSSGHNLVAVNLRIDYQYRGQSLSNMCLYDYATTIKKIEANDHNLAMLSQQETRNRKAYVDRFLYSGGNIACEKMCKHNGIHPQHGTHMQAYHKHGYEPIVLISGKGIPKKDDVEQTERYGLCILILFKPWKTVYDLREHYSSWVEACRAFLNNPSLSPRLQSYINNIELLQRCSEEKELDRALRESSKSDQMLAKARRIDRCVSGYDDISDELELLDNQDYPEEDIDEEKTVINPSKIVESGLKNLDMVRDIMRPLYLRGRFDTSDRAVSPEEMMENEVENEEKEWIDDNDIQQFNDDNVRFSNSYDEELINIWRHTITSRKSAGQSEEDIKMRNTELLDAYIESNNHNETFTNLEANASIEVDDPIKVIAQDLNEEQKKAFYLVCDHRRRNYRESLNQPSQLLLFLTGSGGTGKSKVINAICEYFSHIGKRDTILLLSYTGIAASNIGGSTIHSVCNFGFGKDGQGGDNPTGEPLARLQERWDKIEYVIIDEISMIGQKFLTRFNICVNMAKKCINDTPFGGLNILFAGDFLQLPPVSDLALYTTNKITRVVLSSADVGSSIEQENESRKRKYGKKNSPIGASTVTNAIGRDLWLKVEHAVILKKPMRQIDDPLYATILENIRQGCITEEQRTILRSKILGNNQISTQEWKDASFLVARNEARVKINFEAVKKYACDSRQPIFYSCAEDSYNKNRLYGKIRQSFLSTSDTKDNPLCGILPLCIGMKVVITSNICINDGMANGMQGIIRQIVYDNTTIDYNSSRGKEVILKSPPKYIIIELCRNTGVYKNLPPNHVPIYPIKATCTRTIWRNNGEKIQHNFQRIQLPLTPAYAFTHYKCQGQTLDKAIIDLAGGITSTGLYVMLSRVQRLSDLLILRPFDESLLDFKIPHSLRDELKRLNKCAREAELLEQWPDA